MLCSLRKLEIEIFLKLLLGNFLLIKYIYLLIIFLYTLNLIKLFTLKFDF
jgi:hypothetical protein